MSVTIDAIMKAMPKSSSSNQWCYSMCIGVTGVILRTATLNIMTAKQKPLFSVQYRYIRDYSDDVVQTKLVRIAFRHIGGM